MKKFTLSLLLVCSSFFAFSQVVPKFQFGLKGGMNLSKFSTTNTFSSDNQAGFYVGAWARIGAIGLHLQPELYYSAKNTTLADPNTGVENEVKFHSLDIPVLVGTKFGAAGVGFRLNTGPMVSFVLSDEQSLGNATGNIVKGNFKDQAFAWQFGTGLDIGKLGVDLRYELGLSEISSSNDPAKTKLNLFTLGIAYKLF